MRIRNPDGQEAGACGNATRCVVAPAARADRAGASGDRDRSPALLPSDVLPDGRVQVDMGPAGLDWPDVPLAGPVDTLHLDLALGPVRDPAAARWAIRTPRSSSTILRRIDDRESRAATGARRPLFPERANIGFAQMLAPDRIRAARLGTRRGADARLRLRRLRSPGQRAAARPDRAACHGGSGRRRTGDRRGGRTATC